MTRATLSDVLQPALRDGYAVAGFVCLGWEDARAFATAAEAEGRPVILQAGPGCRAHTPLPVLGAMFRFLADSVGVPVVLHLDHGRSLDEAKAAIAEGFTSVMFDGSALPLDENIRQTAEVAALARAHGVSCEGEIGFVGYDGGADSAMTDPDEAARFARETGIDAMAIAVGNVHLQRDHAGGMDEAAVLAIAKATGHQVPLVIHGGSGVPPDTRAHLARTTPICKFNIGTELRQTFGTALRRTLQNHPDEFDRGDRGPRPRPRPRHPALPRLIAAPRPPCYLPARPQNQESAAWPPITLSRT
jgi:fructose-bisphosphate aldolase, class II